MADKTDVTEKKRRAKPPLMACRDCGRGYAPQRQVQRLKKKLGEKAVMIEICPPCRRKRRTELLHHV